MFDTLDLSLTAPWSHGALCAGQAVEKKIANDVAESGHSNIEDLALPLRLAVFDSAAQRTVWRERGPLARTAAHSAALPVLFAHGNEVDGGWVDHHGFTALRPGERALSLRINTPIEPQLLERLAKRPTTLFNVSADPAHKTLALRPDHKLDKLNFWFAIDLDKPKLAATLDQSQALLR